MEEITSNELKEISNGINYTLAQLQKTSDHLKSSQNDSSETYITNALLESFLIHTRKCLEFFNTNPKHEKRDENDSNVRDFLKGDFLKELSDFILQYWKIDEVQRLDDVITTQLVHVCFIEEYRLVKEWPVDQINIIYKKLEIVIIKWIELTYKTNPNIIGNRWNNNIKKLKNENRIY